MDKVQQTLEQATRIAEELNNQGVSYVNDFEIARYVKDWYKKHSVEVNIKKQNNKQFKITKKE